MDGYLLDTNAASVLWDKRHREHTTIRGFLQMFANGPTWISVVVLGEIEYGLKIVPKWMKTVKTKSGVKWRGFRKYSM